MSREVFFPSMQKILTPDGSVTFHNLQFGEAYHSKSGAKEEAVKKFVEPCQIKELAKTGEIRILDVCFGFGYNTAAAIDAALEENPSCRIEVIGLENDEKMLQMLPELHAPFTHYFVIEETIKNNYIYEKNNIKIKILLGDARETLHSLFFKKTDNLSSAFLFDVVFFDPFSPKKCPELWTKEFFGAVFSLLREGGRLATYSCARVVRDNMRAVGFTILDGPKLWRRGPSTIGIKI